MPCAAGSVSRSAVWPGYCVLLRQTGRKENKSVVGFRPWPEHEAVDARKKVKVR